MRAIVRVAMLVRKIETDFAIDSTWLQTPNSEIQVGNKGMLVKMRNVKLQIAIGVKTVIPFAVLVEDENANDQKALVLGSLFY